MTTLIGKLRKAPFVYLLIALFIMSLPLRSQETINQTDANGKKQGLWQKKYPNGHIRFEGRFVNDLPTGEFKYYHENGKIKAIIKHSSYGNGAEAELYNEEGLLSARGKYLHEKKDGKWIYYIPGKNQISAVEFWKSGQPTGTWKIYFTTDTVVSEYWSFSNGKKQGPWKQFFTDTTPRLEAFYNNDALDGSYKIFYPGNKLRVEGTYNLGQRTGEWKYYTEDLKIKRIEWYQEGEIIKEEILIPDLKEPDTPIDPSLDPEKLQNNY